MGTSDSPLPTEEELQRNLLAAIEAHQARVEDFARLRTSPLTHAQALDQMEACGHLATYVAVTNVDLSAPDKSIPEILAGLLCSEPVIDIEYLEVWALGDVRVLYIRGKLTNQPATV